MSGYFTSSRNSSRTRLGSSDYEVDLLPKVNGGAPGGSRAHIWLSRRYTKLVVATVIAFGLFFSVVSLGSRWRLELRRVPTGGGLAVSVVDSEHDRLPPDWARFREYELQTSEQHGDYPNTKYFFSANHARSESVSLGYVEPTTLLLCAMDGAYMRPFRPLRPLRHGPFLSVLLKCVAPLLTSLERTDCGWGNVFQEMIMNALLAYRMNRT